MDRDTCVTHIKQLAGFRSSGDAIIQGYLNEAQQELERSATLPYWLLQEDFPFTVTAPVSPTGAPFEVALPTGFIKESDEQDGNLRYQQRVPGASLFLKKMDLEEAESWFYSRRIGFYSDGQVYLTQDDNMFAPGTPIAYVLKKSVARFYPGPDRNYSLYWTFYKSDDPLNSSNITNGWTANAPWLLIGEAGLLYAAALRDPDMVAVFKAILEGDPNSGAQGARRRYQAKLYERLVAGRSFSMGSRL